VTGWKVVFTVGVAVSRTQHQAWERGEPGLQGELGLLFARCARPVTCVCSLAVEIATLTRENGKTAIRVLKQKEVEQLIKNHEEEEAKAEREKKEKEQKEKDK